MGVQGRLVEVSGRISNAGLGDVIAELNADARVNGIIVQMPLPRHLELATVLDAIDPGKDIDGIHPMNAGLLALGYDGFLPATARASVELLIRSGIELSGKRAVVLGRSNVVGKPAALLLLRENATVTIAHSRTPDLRSVLREADVLVVAVGRPGLVTGAMLRRGAVVVDVGINVVDGALVGRRGLRVRRDARVGDHPGPGRRGPRDERDPPHPAHDGGAGTGGRRARTRSRRRHVPLRSIH